MTEKIGSPWDSVLDDLERERKALDEAISAYKEIHQKLASLSPHLAQKVLVALHPPSGEPSQQSAIPQSDVKTSGGSLAGKTSAQCARLILQEHRNEPMHFAEI